MKLSKPIITLGIFAILCGGAGIYTTHVQKAEAQGTCSVGNITASVISPTNTMVETGDNDINLGSFKIKNTNTGNCAFTLNHMSFNRLTSSTGTPFAWLRLIDTSNNTMVAQLMAGENVDTITYYLDVPLNTVINVDSSKTYKVIGNAENASAFGNGNSSFFALGLQGISGSWPGSNTGNSIQYIQKWSKIFTVDGN